MLVKNLNGSGEQFPKPTCKCSSWLEHWETNKNCIAHYCVSCNKEINHNELVGGHVIKVNSGDADRYIVPICKSCNNQKNKQFKVDEYDLVLANCSRCKNR